MRQIKIYPLDVGKHRDNPVECGSCASANVDQLVDALEAAVAGQYLRYEKFGGTIHAIVEDLVEPLIDGLVFKYIHSMGLPEWNHPV